MNTRSLTAAWLITLALTVSGLFWLPQRSDDSKASSLSPAGTMMCNALDTAWS